MDKLEKVRRRSNGKAHWTGMEQKVGGIRRLHIFQRGAKADYFQEQRAEIARQVTDAKGLRMDSQKIAPKSRLIRELFQQGR
jgi:hypothetical protein